MRLPSARRFGIVLGAAIAFGCSTPNSAHADTTPIDQALTERMLQLDVSAPHPPVDMSDFDWFRHARAPLGKATGRLVVSSVLGSFSGGGITVYLLPASPYTAWYARLSAENVRGYRGAIATLDPGVRDGCLRFVKTGSAGVFEFDDLPPGPYYVFAALQIDTGGVVPKETLERGWDGEGHGADVRTPNYTFGTDERREEMTWYWGMTFSDPSGEWDAGDFNPNEHFLNGDRVKP